MRTMIAMMVAITAAGLATLFVSPNVADNIVAASRFDAPADAARMHVAIYMATNFAALFAGFGIGWLLGYPLGRRTSA
ncbi:MAG: hypothetical protein ABL907_04490 [Hyphomicrobium sp.]